MSESFDAAIIEALEMEHEHGKETVIVYIKNINQK